MQRGPLIYCAEWVDNNGKTSNIILPETTTFSTEPKQPLLNSITVLSAELPVLSINPNGQEVSTSKRKVTFIPYYSWANRGEGEMIVWFPGSVRGIEILAYSSNTSGK